MRCRSACASGGREHGARPQLQLGAQLLVGELVVALEGDAVDDRVLDHLHHQRVATAPGQADVLEQAGGVERLEAAIDPVGIERVAWLHQHVGADRPGLDTLIALDPDCLNGARRRAGRDLLSLRAAPVRRSTVLGGGDSNGDEQASESEQACTNAVQARSPPVLRRGKFRKSRVPSDGRDHSGEACGTLPDFLRRYIREPDDAVSASTR